MFRKFSWILFALLLAAGLYGFLHERLWAQSMWSQAGQDRFLAYTAVFWISAGAILLLRPRWMGPVAWAAALLYVAWWSGPAAPIAVLYFLGSCLCLGRLFSDDSEAPVAILLGAAVWMSVIWTALHFPINARGVYVAGLAAPYLLGVRSMTVAARKIRLPGRAEAAALAVLLFVLFAHLLAALKPEISADGLSMHLALPMAVAREARWGFDFRLNSWAVMPAGADSLYTAAYLMGGEAAAHLLNFAFLVLTCVLLASAARRWVSPAQAWLVAALFASTPLVQLVTASLFVENVWAAMILAATLSLARYWEEGRLRALLLVAVFTSAAVSVKLIAAAFAAPIVCLAAFALFRRRAWRVLPIAAGLLILFAAPPYVYAFAKTGNPIFPFANAVFRSADFDTTKSFSDPRFTTPLSWKTPYDLTFQSRNFMEAQGGASGFQYFLLLLPAILCARRRDQWIVVAVIAVAGGIILAILPNLRYLYPALPLAGLALAWLEPPVVLWVGAPLLVALNLWFLPSSGFYNGDFALFRHADIQPYIERMAPARVLIADLNLRAPGEPVAFFSTDETGDLRGPAYTDSWHSERYWHRIQQAQNPQEIALILHELGIQHIVAPRSRHASLLTVELFLRRWLEPVREPVGSLGLFRMSSVVHEPDHTPFDPGRYDDLEERIQYSGSWLHDVQFPESWEQSITYSKRPQDAFRIDFKGTAIAYVFTRAANRGIAEVRIDGRLQDPVDEYSARTEWQSKQRFAGLAPGRHSLEIRVSGQKNPQSSGVFVDLDAFVVEP